MVDSDGKKSPVRNALTFLFVLLINGLIVAILYRNLLAAE